ncbi:helix-turn-helix domain-containing protein [Clostridium sp. HV4-5-A1G]|uniref:helix-turn-helix domain-containing protein n=1 Tax=Clostridium sp. HV4-5-A1G TaxID=2004595 RepID=UPI001681D5C8|nr:helix-turn-helix transcriptional regulator [Clostridium sp. HV4-5-A1G]
MKNNNQVKLGYKIKKFREARNLTQDDLATKLNISKYTIAKYEQNQRTPSIDMIDKLVEALNISWGDLIDDEKLRKEFKTAEENIVEKSKAYKVYKDILKYTTSEFINYTLHNFGYIDFNKINEEQLKKQIDSISSKAIDSMIKNIDLMTKNIGKESSDLQNN